MLSHRMFRYLVLTAGALTVISCGDYTSPTSPTQSRLLPPTLIVGASFARVAGGSLLKAVKWGPSHSRIDQSVSAVVGSEGATLSLPGSDFSMTIPAGALSVPTTITIVSRGGPYVVYDMLPHGLRFNLPVIADQGLSATASYGTAAGNSVRSAYLPVGSEQIGFDGSASPVEVEAATTYFYGVQPVAGTHAWILNHFSRYILISGVWVSVGD
jgi:ZU5 domain